MKTFKKISPLKFSLAVMGASMMTSVAQADIEISDNLSITGFIDMSTYYEDVDGGTSTNTSGLDQMEMDFMYDFGEGLTAQVDLQYTNPDPVDPTVGGTAVEQGFFVYSLSDALSFKAGRFLAYSGWEAAEPTGLYQYSASPLASTFYGGYQQGASVLYSSETFEVAATIANSLVDGLETDSKKAGVETMLAFMPSEELTLKAFYLSEADDDTVDVWGSYTMDSFTFALEYAMSDYANDDEASGYLAMVNYAKDKLGLTLRYHALEAEDASGTTTTDTTGITFSPSYALHENLLIVAEYRVDSDDLTDTDTTSAALEALISY